MSIKTSTNSKPRVESFQQNFGYLTKNYENSSTAELPTKTSTAKTAAVSAVPRINKLTKVPGSTQTVSIDFQQSKYREIWMNHKYVPFEKFYLLLF